MLKLMQLLFCQFEFRNALVKLNFFAGLRMFLAVSFFLCCFPEDQVCYLEATEVIPARGIKEVKKREKDPGLTSRVVLHGHVPL
jgi:hypothetical protein